MGKADRLRADHAAITWAWNILKVYNTPRDDPEYWDEVIRRVANGCDDDVYKELGNAVLNILDHRHREMKKREC